MSRLIVVFSLLLGACSPAGPYREGPPGSPDGSGRFYMGREIPRALDTQPVAVWLDRPAREVEEFPARLVAALDVGPSDIVADIGAGTGYFTLRLSEAVPHGRVLAVDVDPAMLDTIRIRVTHVGLRNVDTILGTEMEPNLADESIDLALIVDSYHEFTYPREMLSAIVRALRPGGRLALVEYRGEDPTLPAPDVHRMTVAQIRLEGEAVGLEWRRNLDVLPQQNLVFFRKPIR